MAECILSLKNISKSFPGVRALYNVSFELRRGEIHALMGENGAGKSTFIKVITGVNTPDTGEITLYGETVKFANPNEAAEKSIAAIYQHSTSYPYLSVTENMFLGHEILKKPFNTIDWHSMHLKAADLMASLGCEIDPHTMMGNLSVAERQVVEIAKAVSTNAKIIIMDEPTAALSKRECEQLYDITEKLKNAGASIIFISHRIEDMYRLADRVTVLRDGEYIDTWNVSEISKERLISAMVGRDITQLFPKQKVDIGEVIFEVENLTKVGFFKDVSLNVRKGEILGLTGLVGAGRSEVCQTLAGILSKDSGVVRLYGKTLNYNNPHLALKLGIGYLPEDRMQQGLLLNWEIYKNITLPELDKYTNITGIKNAEERKSASTLCERIGVKATNVYERVKALSGGNQQKVIIAKLLNTKLKVLLMDEPTKGVDVGAKSQIYAIISELAKQGYAIILVSSEMPEVMSMCDRVIVMHEGRIAAEYNIAEVNQELILEAAMFSDKQNVVGEIQ